MIRTRFLSLLSLLALVPSLAMCIEIPENKHGLAVVKDVDLYRRLVEKEPAKALVNLQTFIPGIDLEVRYATASNFMNEKLYPVAKAFLRKPAAEALKEAQQDFEKQGFGLRVFDGYRPYRVTEKMWERYEDPNYVADPKHGSRHNRGCAVDVTLISLATGEPLEMPTGYDDFTEKAHEDYQDLPETVLANRKLLREIMEKNGFDVLPSEWWHFDFRGWDAFELMDIPLTEIEQAVDAAAVSRN